MTLTIDNFSPNQKLLFENFKNFHSGFDNVYIQSHPGSGKSSFLQASLIAGLVPCTDLVEFIVFSKSRSIEMTDVFLKAKIVNVRCSTVHKFVLTVAKSVLVRFKSLAFVGADELQIQIFKKIDESWENQAKFCCIGENFDKFLLEKTFKERLAIKKNIFLAGIESLQFFCNGSTDEVTQDMVLGSKLTGYLRNYSLTFESFQDIFDMKRFVMSLYKRSLTGLFPCLHDVYIKAVQLYLKDPQSDVTMVSFFTKVVIVDEYSKYSFSFIEF